MDMEPAGLSPAAECNAPGWTTDCHTSDVGHLLRNDKHFDSLPLFPFRPSPLLLI